MKKYIFNKTSLIAKELDNNDKLSKFRKYFHFPSNNNKSYIYLSGNSLGLQPHNLKNNILNEKAVANITSAISIFQFGKIITQ